MADVTQTNEEADEGVTAAEAVTAEEARLWAEMEKADATQSASDAKVETTATENADDKAGKDRAGDAAAADTQVAADEAGEGSEVTDAADPKPESDKSTASNAKAAAAADGGSKAKPAAQSAPVLSLSEQELAALPEPARRELERLAQENRAHRGRQSYLTRVQSEIATLRAENESLKKGTGKAGTSAEGETPAEWAELERTYPEIAAGLKAKFGSEIENLKKENAELKAFKGSLTDKDHDTFVNGQIELLAEAHPDWVDVANSAEYREWLRQQPDVVQSAHRKNAKEMVDAASAEVVIGLFKSQHPTWTPKAGGGNAKETPSGRAAGGNGNNATGSSRRARQLEGAASPAPGTRSAVPQKGIPREAESDEQMWNYWEREEQAAARSGARAS